MNSRVERYRQSWRLRIEPDPGETRRIERWLATARVFLAVSTLVAIRMDPTELGNSWAAYGLFVFYLATGILILPQRQTALVAKQAAEIDVLSGGRLRLGIGVGWNAVEFEALNETFENRGRRSAEQIEVMRRLWTQEVVDYRGTFHRISHAGLNPMPIQRPIPIWFGIGSRGQTTPPEAALRRIGRLADGWSPNFSPDAQSPALVARVHQYARDAGRDPSALPLEGRIRFAGQGPEGWMQQVEAWKTLGATSLIAEARGETTKFPDGHLEALRRFKAMLDHRS